MQGRDAQLRALLAIILVVVIRADRSHPILAEDSDQPIGERAFPGSAIADNGKDDGTMFIHKITFLIPRNLRSLAQWRH